MVFAIAHVRGGGEMGRHWYDQGKTLTKKNTFTDFVAAARHLSAEGWTSPDRLVGEGGSAGGLLVGAVANMAPDAFAGIVAAVPFVDNLTTILDPSLPLTVIEWDEWGDPLHDAEVYAYMKSYAPTRTCTAQEYPPILAITSLNEHPLLSRGRQVGAGAATEGTRRCSRRDGRPAMRGSADVRAMERRLPARVVLDVVVRRRRPDGSPGTGESVVNIGEKPLRAATSRSRDVLAYTSLSVVPLESTACPR
jgi:hypothetical protein